MAEMLNLLAKDRGETILRYSYVLFLLSASRSTVSKSMAPCIPRLTSRLYTAGTRHAAPVPKLIQSNVNTADGSFDFEWEARGSEVYHVTANGRLDNNNDGGGGSCWKGMSAVHCTCPSFEEQDLATTDSGWRVLYVCKHLKAALDSVCDQNADQTKRAKEAATEKPKKKKKRETTGNNNDDDDDAHSETRQRLEHGLSKRTDSEIVKLLKERMQESEEGLQAVAQVFPPHMMPLPTAKW